MDPYENNEAERLVQRWKNGDQSAWAPLRHMIENRMIRRITEVSGITDPEHQAQLDRMVVEIFNKLLQEGQLTLEHRDRYETVFAHSLRHVLVTLINTADPILNTTALLSAKFHHLR